MDSPSTFYFNLEKKGIQQKTMCHLRRPDGSITSDPAEMRRLASDFYKQLYSAESCDAESAEDLLKELPQLHETQKEEIDRTINLQELIDAMSQLSTGRSPGIGILLSSVSIRKCLLGNGITKLGHLLNEEGWIPTEELKAVTGLRSSRLAAKLQEELCNTLPSSYRTYIGQRHETTQDRKSDGFPGL
ncbi:hypothetical protein QTP70_031935 [Hemibagrus guttatus]|uniref:Uncharacterized protein n=1 Tax=Hemibagrus guttatus TaxID=175788 RepID=A0AAE0UK94_9TELE|nr:hypothetical protein QTP70_031935 [Hemibagrus guttatus]